MNAELEILASVTVSIPRWFYEDDSAVAVEFVDRQVAYWAKAEGVDGEPSRVVMVDVVEPDRVGFEAVWEAS